MRILIDECVPRQIRSVLPGHFVRTARQVSFASYKNGQLIEAAGCKGLRVGSAVVSEKHANFILVDPGGRANDVYALLVLVRDRVLASSGVHLQIEHRLLGFGVTQ